VLNRTEKIGAIPDIAYIVTYGENINAADRKGRSCSAAASDIDIDEAATRTVIA